MVALTLYNTLLILPMSSWNSPGSYNGWIGFNRDVYMAIIWETGSPEGAGALNTSGNCDTGSMINGRQDEMGASRNEPDQLLTNKTVMWPTSFIHRLGTDWPLLDQATSLPCNTDRTKLVTARFCFYMYRIFYVFRMYKPYAQYWGLVSRGKHLDTSTMSMQVGDNNCWWKALLIQIRGHYKVDACICLCMWSSAIVACWILHQNIYISIFD